MAQAVRAVYEQGWLRLLDPVNLIEGQEVHVMLVSERERARDVLDEILVQYEPEPVEEIDEIKLQVEIVSGVFRRRRESLIPPRTAQAIRLLLHRHVKREYMVVELTAPIIQDA